ncbi:hypothetical protein C8J56DRAFT_888100 [Mycena floridula]|nr:hypothetical protein C8J56DRAFT_888100 [Mycena floridula]
MSYVQPEIIDWIRGERNQELIIAPLGSFNELAKIWLPKTDTECHFGKRKTQKIIDSEVKMDLRNFPIWYLSQKSRKRASKRELLNIGADWKLLHEEWSIWRQPGLGYWSLSVGHHAGSGIVFSGYTEQQRDDEGLSDRLNTMDRVQDMLTNFLLLAEAALVSFIYHNILDTSKGSGDAQNASYYKQGPTTVAGKAGYVLDPKRAKEEASATVDGEGGILEQLKVWSAKTEICLRCDNITRTADVLGSEIYLAKGETTGIDKRNVHPLPTVDARVKKATSSATIEITLGWFNGWYWTTRAMRNKSYDGLFVRITGGAVMFSVPGRVVCEVSVEADQETGDGGVNDLHISLSLNASLLDTSGVLSGIRAAIVSLECNQGVNIVDETRANVIVVPYYLLAHRVHAILPRVATDLWDRTDMAEKAGSSTLVLE